jgi:hypothetical protein
MALKTDGMTANRCEAVNQPGKTFAAKEYFAAKERRERKEETCEETSVFACPSPKTMAHIPLSRHFGAGLPR